MKTLLIITAYIAPFLFLPAAFRWTGGVFATLTGAVNNRGKGLFDRQRKFRGASQQSAKENLKSSNRFAGGTENNFRGRLNRRLQTASLLNEARAHGDIRPSQLLHPGKMRDQLRSRVDNSRGVRNFDAASKIMQENTAFNAAAGDDIALWGMMEETGTAEGVAETLEKFDPKRFGGPEHAKQRDDLVQHIQELRRQTGTEQLRIAATRAQFKTGTGYNYRYEAERDEETGEVKYDEKGDVIFKKDENGHFVESGDDDYINAINRAVGNDRIMAGRILAEGRGAAVQSGRYDIGGGGFGVQAGAMQSRWESDMPKADGTHLNPGDKGYYSQAESRKTVKRDVLRSNAGAAMAGKPKSVEMLAPQMYEQANEALQKSIATDSEDDIARELAFMSSKYDAAAQVGPNNAQRFADNVLSQEVDFETLSPSLKKAFSNLMAEQHPDGSISYKTSGKINYQQMIESMRSNPKYQLYRREYQSSILNAAAAAQAAVTGATAAPGGTPGGPIGGPPGAAE